MCGGCASVLRDALRGIAVLAALGGLAALLLGLHALLPLGSAALDPTISWFALLLCATGLVLVLLGGTAGLGCMGPIHCVSTARHARQSARPGFAHDRVPLLAPQRRAGPAPAAKRWRLLRQPVGASPSRFATRSSQAPAWRCCPSPPCWCGPTSRTASSCAGWQTATRATR